MAFSSCAFAGFYLYMLVVETFSADKIKLRIYAFIGWGKQFFYVFHSPSLLIQY